MDIEAAVNISGWMSVKELEWLAEQASKHNTIVEIGSFMGRSTRALGDNTPGIVYAIDDFVGPRDMGLPEWFREHLFEMFSMYNQDLIDRGKVFPVIADHREIKLKVKPDMVFLDGSHEYEDVKYDIDRWEGAKLICGHDFTNMHPVRQAVQEKFKDFKVVEGTSIWYVER